MACLAEKEPEREGLLLAQQMLQAGMATLRPVWGLLRREGQCKVSLTAHV